MTEALLELLPDSPVYHVGMYRNPGSNIPVQYYNRLPKGHPSDVALILDPIIASCENASPTKLGIFVSSLFQNSTCQAIVMSFFSVWIKRLLHATLLDGRCPDAFRWHIWSFLVAFLSLF